MERKGTERKGSTAVVTKELVETGLKTANTTNREEQALRMLYGVSVGRKHTLPQVHGGNAGLADELLLIEMQLLKGLRARQATKVAATKNAVKSKIAAKLSTK